MRLVIPTLHSATCAMTISRETSATNARLDGQGRRVLSAGHTGPVINAISACLPLVDPHVQVVKGTLLAVSAINVSVVGVVISVMSVLRILVENSATTVWMAGEGTSVRCANLIGREKIAMPASTRSPVQPAQIVSATSVGWSASHARLDGEARVATCVRRTSAGKIALRA